MEKKSIRLMLCFLMMVSIFVGIGSVKSAFAEDTVTLEFSQWWEPELPQGAFRSLMDKFEEQNPGIKVELLSGPYSSTKEQIVAGAATGTMSDVVGLDGAWVNDFVKQGAITDLSKLMTDAGYDASALAAQIQINGATYMIPVVNFVYPLFINDDILKSAGVESAPSTRSEFAAAAKAMTNPEANVYGWVLPLSLEVPNGIQNDVMSWVWASGKSMLKDGKPDVTNSDVKSAVEFIKGLYDAGVIAPGAFTMKEQDKVEEFTNGRVGMMIDSLAHINTIRERNPELKFSLAAVPAEDGYDGKRGLPYASWGIGIAENSQHKAEAWKLVEFLMSEEVNSELSTIANAFPGNVNSVPDFVKTDELFGSAFEIYQKGYPANEFVGLPVAEDLMRAFDEQFQLMLEGDQTVDEMLQKVQEAWLKEF
ncbi:MAG TPA: sugar ABC transporter substrate-binding protein [Flexilinea sp.]|jgi:multiple sugar transport system substrate-binding protein|nr:MAG: Lipoprotein LipO precursor [Chloroflexi bacterium ADurb.Bin344]HOG22300.1 sugar ABC transporter substrate-binding protein [Flexilinea sp.]HOR56535.1 sugar ABC transporter substrate-binding protein [Flexilinea sp.]HPG20299.1 sugar ABC transporter substrate-binding protein [Flexilinea sp.]HQN62089.1 sugar ABC transporter substrate-binding protein [Flexilinea sp.]